MRMLELVISGLFPLPPRNENEQYFPYFTEVAVLTLRSRTGSSTFQCFDVSDINGREKR